MRVATYTEASAPTRGSGFAMMVLITTLLLGTGVVPTMAESSGGIFARLITPSWLALYLGSTLGLMFTHGINWISWLVRYRLLLVILLLGSLVSVSWSLDAQVSAERVVHLLGSSLIAIYIGFSVPLLLTLRVFAIVLGIMMVASVGVVFFTPGIGIESYEGSQVWRGVFNSKNDLGFWAAVGALLYVTLSESSHATVNKFLCFMLAGVSLGVLLMSQSATSLLAMLVGGSLALYLYIAGRFQLGFFRMVFIAILFVALTVLAVSNVATTELVGRSGDLTGRGEVWTQVIDMILQHPLTGVGYGVLWFPTDDTIWLQQSLFDFSWVVHHAHNGLLQVASEIGMPMAVIALLMVAQQSVEIFYCQYERRQVGVLFVLAFVAAFLVSNYSEARFLVTRELFWIFFLALPISMLRQVNVMSADVHDYNASPRPDQADGSAEAAASDKPWLDVPLGGFGQTGAHARLPVGAPVPYALEHNADASQTHGTNSSQDLFGDGKYDEMKFSGLSVDEADIDLGENASSDQKAADSKDDSGDASVSEPNQLSGELIQRDNVARKHAKGENVSMIHDHMFYEDRFDIHFDDDNEWIDIGSDIKKTR